MPGNKALKRALETKDSIRIGTDLPLITDETILITPEIAREWLTRNRRNRPVNWRKAEAYARIMAAGKWELHSQGIIFDTEGNLLTGQNRLWGVILSKTPIYFRVSRGNRKEVADLLDRGSPQTARDLATRRTEKKHSPIEAMMARGILALEGNMRPTIDEVGAVIVKNTEMAALLLPKTARMKKTKARLMILAAICATNNKEKAERLILHLSEFESDLEKALQPVGAEKCWGKGTAFGMAMALAKKTIG